MKDFIVNVSAKTSKVYLEQTSIAVDGENIAGKIIFKFDGNNFIDGVARLEWQNGSDKYFQLMEKVDKTYVLPIKNAMTKEGKMYFQLVITQAEVDEEIPVFKSNQFYVFVEKSINAEGEAPDEYATWLDTANEKIAEIDNINIIATKSGNTETITLTDKQGIEHKTYIYDGEKGDTGSKGADAKINGVNTLNILAGQNITIDQEGSNLTINSQGGSSGSGNVDDVKVNGTSVVENKIANIDLTGKQDLLVSGTNIKTINNNSILGSGDIEIGGGGSSTDVQINGTSITSSGVANILTNTAYNSSTNKIATMSDIPNISAKYYINGDYLIYNVSPSNYSISPNSTSNNTKTKLPFNEIAEAISLSYTNDKYLILNIFTTNMVADVMFYFPTKFFTNYQQNVGYAQTYYSSTGNMWSSYMTINYSYSGGTFTVNSINCRGDSQKTIGIGNNNEYTPSNPYNPATKKYVDDIVGDIESLLGGI